MANENTEYTYIKDGTDMFANWEPNILGEEYRAIKNSLFKNTGDNNKSNDLGYLAYNEDITRGAIKEETGLVAETAWLVDDNGNPFAGCRKGSLVKAGTGHSLMKKTGEDSHEIYYLQYSEANNALYWGYDATEIDKKVDGSDNLWRVGIVLVGQGGCAGSDKSIHYECCSGFDMRWPGTGGGGAGTVWGILNIRDFWKDPVDNIWKMRYPKFQITIPSTNTREGENGLPAEVEVISVKVGDAERSESGVLLQATGGGGGSTGGDSGQIKCKGVGGDGSKDKSEYHLRIGAMAGEMGAGYSPKVDGENSDGFPLDPPQGRTISISFLADSHYVTTYTTSGANLFGDPTSFKDAKGSDWLGAPGGSSLGQGAHAVNDQKPGSSATASKTYFTPAGPGGGGMGCSHKDSSKDPFDEWNYGGPGYFELFY